jgi:hypothetical protein
VLTAAVALAAPAAAWANDFQRVYDDYKRSGAIKPCKYSNQQLANAERQTPPDVEQDARSFLDALSAARERGADCGGKAAPAAAPAQSDAPPPSTPQPAPAATTPQPATPQPTTTAAATPPAPTVPVQPSVAGVPSPPIKGAKQEDSAPPAVWTLAALGALALLLAALWAALAWWFGWSADPWTRPFGASASDFADRLRDGRLEFTDWLRTGI